MGTIIVVGLLAVLSSYIPALTREVVIGIDLGTTYSVVAVCVAGEVHVIQQDSGSNLLPSWVHFGLDGRRLVGQPAKDVGHLHPADTVYDAKRIIGRNFDDEIVQEELATFPFKVLPSDDSPPLPLMTVKEAAPESYYPQNISSIVLKELKRKLEEHFRWRRLLGWKVKSATVSVPANFDVPQKLATLEAGWAAGFSTVQLIEEPAAAALAYRLHQQVGVTNVLVFDFGGGTLDVALLLLDKQRFIVVNTAGDPHLGGEDLDRLLLAELQTRVARETGLDAFAPRTQEALRRAAEHLKVALSNQTAAEVEVALGDRQWTARLSKAELEAICADLFERAMVPVRTVLTDSEMDKTEIGNIVLVGGSSRIPKVRELLSAFFDGAKLNYDMNPDEAIARGATLTRTCQ